MRLSQLITVLWSACAINTGCGGGNNVSNASGSEAAVSVKPIATFNVSAALSNVYSLSRNFALEAKDSTGNILTMKWIISTPVSQSEPSFGYAHTPADKKIQIQFTIAINNGPPSTVVTYDRYIRSNPFAYSYLQRGDGVGAITIYNQLSSIPENAIKPFDKIPLSSGKIFGPQYIGDTTLSISLTSTDDSTGIFCLGSNDSLADVFHASAPEECIKINPAGQVMGMRILFPSPINGELLYFQ